MHVPEIIQVKEHFEEMKSKGLIKSWELPYENLLTRRSAAIFFFTPNDNSNLETINQELMQYEHFTYRDNTEKKLSVLAFRVTFNEEEKEKNIVSTQKTS